MKRHAGKANIVRESENAIPHIFADTLDLAMYCVGYTHAMDRLWQMNYIRAVSYGNLSSLFGNMTLDIDKSMRVLDFSGHSDKVLQNTPRHLLKQYEEYAAGINDYVNSIRLLPTEFWILRVSFDPWTVKDCLMIGKMMHFITSQGWQGEII